MNADSIFNKKLTRIYCALKEHDVATAYQPSDVLTLLSKHYLGYPANRRLPKHHRTSRFTTHEAPAVGSLHRAYSDMTRSALAPCIRVAA